MFCTSKWTHNFVTVHCIGYCACVRVREFLARDFACCMCKFTLRILFSRPLAMLSCCTAQLTLDGATVSASRRLVVEHRSRDTPQLFLGRFASVHGESRFGVQRASCTCTRPSIGLIIDYPILRRTAAVVINPTVYSETSF